VPLLFVCRRDFICEIFLILFYGASVCYCFSLSSSYIFSFFGLRQLYWERQQTNSCRLLLLHCSFYEVSDYYYHRRHYHHRHDDATDVRHVYVSASYTLTCENMVSHHLILYFLRFRRQTFNSSVIRTVPRVRRVINLFILRERHTNDFSIRSE